MANLAELKRALEGFVARCKKDFLPPFQTRAEFAAVSDEDVAQLLRRLANDILPNIIPNETLLGSPASFATILNASALYRANLLLKRDPTKTAEEISKDLQKLERLTSKAMEVSYVQRQFNEWKRTKKP